VNLVWTKGRLEGLAGRAKHASFQIAEKIRDECTHEPLTVAQEVELEQKLEAAVDDLEQDTDGSDPSGDVEPKLTPVEPRIDPLDEDAADDDSADERAVVWGQYLDEYHRSETQWGIYGTSAALQILALQAVRRGDDPAEEEQVAAALPLPETVRVWDPRLQKKVDKGDLENIVKLAFIAEAHQLGRNDVPLNEEPAIVREIVRRAVKGQFWSSRLREDRLRVKRDHEFPTATVLFALKRYQYLRTHKIWGRVRPWLARKVTTTDGLRTPAMFGLCGLALLPDDGEAGSQVPTALAQIDQYLCTWARAQKEILLTRPIFNGFAIGESHDYVFLHPELLSALYFLERGSVEDARDFVLRVIEALCGNVENHQGAFEGQSRTVSTLDQLWAVRLLERFVTVYESSEGWKGLLPKWRYVPLRLRRHLRRRFIQVASGLVLSALVVAAIGAVTGEWYATAIALVLAFVAPRILRMLWPKT
jgi:hypothetical protein